MDFTTALKISGSGLSAQRTWMNVLSTNLANVNTTRTPSGKPFQRLNAVYEATPIQEEFEHALDDALTEHLHTVKVSGLEADKRDFKAVYEPGHPDANEEGILTLPNINSIEEMANLVGATRSYEANLTALHNARQMALKALEIGRS